MGTANDGQHVIALSESHRLHQLQRREHAGTFLGAWIRSHAHQSVRFVSSIAQALGEHGYGCDKGIFGDASN